MAKVRLRGQLEKLAGAGSEHEVSGATVNELLTTLESTHSALKGWILDERGVLRRHINVFVMARSPSRTPPSPTATGSRSFPPSPAADPR